MELMIRICRLIKLAMTTKCFIIKSVFFIFLSLLTGPFLSYGAEESIEVKKDIRAGDILTVDSPAFVGSPSEYAPLETVMREGKKYYLTSSEILNIFTEEKTEYSESSILYEGVEYIDRMPETAWVQITDEDLKVKQTVELPVVSQVEERSYWDYNFTFPIEVSGYQEDTYLLGDKEIPNGAPLTDYGLEFLKYLNLPEDYYQITSIVWTGESVERNGDMVRNAQAQGKKLVKNIRAVYGGEVTVPSVQAQIYRGFYEEDRTQKQTDPPIYKNSETAVYERQAWNEYRKIVRYIITITITLTVLLMLLTFILILLKRKKKAEAESEPDSQPN